MHIFFFILHTSFMNIKASEYVNKIKAKMQNNEDVIVRRINIGENKAFLIFIDEIVNQEEINLHIINALHKYTPSNSLNLEEIKNECVSFGNAVIALENEVEEKILKGHAALIIDNETRALCFNVFSFQGRGIEEPPSSTVISGPREGFNESIKTNVALIRKRIISTKLKIEDLSAGVLTKTSIKLLYLTNIVDNRVVKEIKKKISNINIDGILDSYYLGTLLENKPNSIFRQVGTCEKPDIACAKMLEGRVVILVDGSPIALTVPFVLFEDFQSSNDYYSEPHRATTLRVLRILALFLSIYLPGLYIALQLYHYKVLPLKFLVTIVNTTQNLPLNPFLEIFFIIILFDILFEASIRMPKYLGIAVSIIGALILGDTAVKAGLVSPPGVMIVALSAITIYIIPSQSSQISLLRLIFAFIGGLLGSHGIILSSMFLLAYLANFDSYYSPYLAPFAPYVLSDQKDGLTKDNVLSMKLRPQSISNKNKIRQKIKPLIKEIKQKGDKK